MRPGRGGYGVNPASAGLFALCVCLMTAVGSAQEQSGQAVSGPLGPEKISAIDAPALAEKIALARKKKASFKLIDLRLEAEYQMGSIPDAINIPQAKLRFLAERQLDKNEEIIFFGRSRKDMASINAGIFLVNKGYQKVVFFEGGYEAWQACQTVKVQQ